MAPDPVTSWLEALDARHLADLTPGEAARALRALSSCYVERRGRLAQGGALDGAGKRAAFALFYGPLHLFLVREVLASLPPAARQVHRIVDLGCGTGVAGAAWSMAAGGARVSGIDRHPWAVAEANWTYRALGIAGRASRADIGRLEIAGARGAGIVAAFTVNELPDAMRTRLLPRLMAAHAHGAHALIVEPIGRRVSGWWDDWAREFEARGGRAGEWRFRVAIPERQRSLGRAAGLDPQDLTSRTLWI